LSQYYYTIASLPFLDFDSDPPVTQEEFLEACRKECSKKDFSLLKDISLVPPDSPCGWNPLVHGFYAWERSLRNELVLLRAKKMGIDPDAYIREGKEELEAVQAARSAFQNESPLGVEKVLNRARWMYLDYLETGHFFDLEKLIVYKLKLEILEQKAKADRDKGREMYTTIMQHFEEKLVSLESNNE
jgi:hypothetical protein